jgi:radical SAM protein with 4Fe4S-binding SPASM domain
MSDKKVEGFYKKYDYMAKAPYFIEVEDLTDKQKHLLLESDTFCMLPWMHMHAFPDGRAYPCCLADYWYPVGDLRKHTMEEVWNQDHYKTMRKNMLEGKKCSECTKCYEQEENGFFSMRNDSNRNYGHHIANVEANTHADGYNEEFKIRYWDVRFSNLCNMRCRSCGPIFSSNWYNDHVKMYDTVPKAPDYALGVREKFRDRDMARVEYTTGDEDGMLSQMEPHIPYLEQVYFAGGEPLIMKEHYFMLEKLIEYDKQDVRIQYNTNFSELRFKDKHVFDYWKHFKNVSVGASLDAMGERAELMRKGTDWQQTLENRRRMIAEVPHVDFYISATVSSMNIMHVMDFHREWVDLGLIKPQDFNINICQSPEWYRIDIFPQEFKAKIRSKVEEHLLWLEPQDKLQRASNGYRSLLNYLDSNDGSEHYDRWIKETELLDNIRQENFWETFPEFKELR